MLFIDISTRRNHYICSEKSIQCRNCQKKYKQLNYSKGGRFYFTLFFCELYRDHHFSLIQLWQQQCSAEAQLGNHRCVLDEKMVSRKSDLPRIPHQVIEDPEPTQFLCVAISTTSNLLVLAKRDFLELVLTQKLSYLLFFLSFLLFLSPFLPNVSQK